MVSFLLWPHILALRYCGYFKLSFASTRSLFLFYITSTRTEGASPYRIFPIGVPVNPDLPFAGILSARQ